MADRSEPEEVTMYYTIQLELDDRFNPGSLAAHTIAELGDVWGANIPPASWAAPQSRTIDMFAESEADARSKASIHPIIAAGFGRVTNVLQHDRLDQAA
jgi:hypothetical protein